MEIKQPRKIIQLTATRQYKGDDIILALCDDGSVWLLMYAKQWVKLSDIPQD